MPKLLKQGIQADYTLDGGRLLTVKFSGVVTPQALDEAKAEIARAVGRGAAGVVADYRAALVFMSDAELRRMMLGGEFDLPHLPAAVVSRPDTSRSFRHFALDAILAGRQRKVFHDPAQALAWTRERAVLVPCPAERPGQHRQPAA